MRKFIEDISLDTPQLTIKWNKGWIVACELGISLHGCLLRSFEEQIFITYMGMQDRTVSWCVVYTQIDNRVKVKQGEFKLRVEYLIAGDETLIKALNLALTELLSDWTPEHLPEEA